MKTTVIDVAGTLVQGGGCDCVINHLNTATTSNSCLLRVFFFFYGFSLPPSSVVHSHKSAPSSEFWAIFRLIQIVCLVTSNLTDKRTSDTLRLLHKTSHLVSQFL